MYESAVPSRVSVRRVSVLLALLFALPALAAAVSATSSGAAAPPDRNTVPAVSSSAAVTALDLDFVATKNGEPVIDLRREEIVLEVNGKKVAIDFFSRPGESSPANAVETPEPARPIVEAKGAGRDLLVFVDELHLQPADRKRALAAVRSLVSRVPPGDRLSLVVCAEAARTIVPFTSDPAEVLAGLAEVEARPDPAGLRWYNRERSVQADLQGDKSIYLRPDAGRVLAQRRATLMAWTSELFARDEAFLQELSRTVSAFASRPGGKVLLFLSSGFELLPGDTLRKSYLGSSDSLPPSLLPGMQDLLRKANQSGITFHAVHASGLEARAEVDATIRGSVGFVDKDGNAFSGPALSASPVDEIARTAGARQPLATLAVETGGFFVGNRNDLGSAVETTLEMARKSYSVGVTLPGAPPAGGSFSVKVSVKRPGVNVFARRSWSARTADELAKDRVEAALLDPRAPSDFDVKLGVEEASAEKPREVPFALTIPVRHLTFVEKDGRMQATVDVTVAAIDAVGARSSVEPQRGTIFIPREEHAQAQKAGVYTHRGTLVSLPGEVRFVAAVRDVLSERIGIASCARPAKQP